MLKYTLIGLSIILATGCASHPPAWQQELNNLHRHHRAETTPIAPDPAGASRPDYSAAGLYACGINSDYRH